MSVNLIIAAGLFDSPWTVVVFVLAGAIINWLTKRRAEKAASDQAPDSATPAPKPPAALPWEERLRQMLEQGTAQPPQPTAPPPPQVPPLIRRIPVPRPVAPPVMAPVERPAAPLRRPPPVEMISKIELESSEPTARRYELSDAAHAAQAQHAIRRLQQAKPKRPILGSLRHPQTARRAFATSLVFGPPKGLEL